MSRNLQTINFMFGALLFGALVLATAPAQAFFIEPYAGYESGEFDPNGAPSFDVAGVSYGLRLGFDFLGFRLGAEYGAGAVKGEFLGVDEKFEPVDVGLYAGYEFPILVKVWTVYAPNTKAGITEGGVESPNDLEEGTTMKVGVAYSGFLFDIGIEKITRKYKKLGTTHSGGHTYDLNTMGAFLMFSFP
ncbi:MAG: hypothetical protein IT288_09055 [Bdellovibrionales bacterium]|nr:hypothetical protein [Bdellovibrionales bacterium]